MYLIVRVQSVNGAVYHKELKFDFPPVAGDRILIGTLSLTVEHIVHHNEPDEEKTIPLVRVKKSGPGHYSGKDLEAVSFSKFKKSLQ